MLEMEKLIVCCMQMWKETKNGQSYYFILICQNNIPDKNMGKIGTNAGTAR